MGSGMTGKLGRAWVCAWHGAWVGAWLVDGGGGGLNILSLNLNGQQIVVVHRTNKVRALARAHSAAQGEC